MNIKITKSALEAFKLKPIKVKNSEMKSSTLVEDLQVEFSLMQRMQAEKNRVLTESERKAWEEELQEEQKTTPQEFVKKVPKKYRKAAQTRRQSDIEKKIANEVVGEVAEACVQAVDSVLSRYSEGKSGRIAVDVLKKHVMPQFFRIISKKHKVRKQYGPKMRDLLSNQKI